VVLDATDVAALPLSGGTLTGPHTKTEVNYLFNQTQ